VILISSGKLAKMSASMAHAMMTAAMIKVTG
jgi:hypothetical protein